jgi:hypothetical protein
LEANNLVKKIYEKMGNRKIEGFIKKTPEGEAIAMALIFYLGIAD